MKWNCKITKAENYFREASLIRVIISAMQETKGPVWKICNKKFFFYLKSILKKGTVEFAFSDVVGLRNRLGPPLRVIIKVAKLTPPFYCN